MLSFTDECFDICRHPRAEQRHSIVRFNWYFEFKRHSGTLVSHFFHFPQFSTRHHSATSAGALWVLSLPSKHTSSLATDSVVYHCRADPVPTHFFHTILPVTLIHLAIICGFSCYSHLQPGAPPFPPVHLYGTKLTRSCHSGYVNLCTGTHSRFIASYCAHIKSECLRVAVLFALGPHFLASTNHPSVDGQGAIFQVTTLLLKSEWFWTRFFFFSFSLLTCGSQSLSLKWM